MTDRNPALAAQFQKELQTWLTKVDKQWPALFVNVANRVKDSITLGSGLTGAPGQPVDTGHLRASWQVVYESKYLAFVMTNVLYAPFIEEGISGRGVRLMLRSPVGGFHSVKLTRANFDRLVYAGAAEVRASHG